MITLYVGDSARNKTSFTPLVNALKLIFFESKITTISF